MLNSIPVSCFRPLVVVNPRFRKPVTSQEYADARELHWPDFVENYRLKVPCGKCYLCRKKIANGWRVRLLEESRITPKFRYAGVDKYRIIFVCFTFANHSLPKYNYRSNVADCIRHWRDLWRKKYGCSPRYFATTDRGTQYGRLHLHLLIFDPFDKKVGKPLSIHRLEQSNFHWKYGKVREPTWLNSERGITYVTGYITGSNLEKEAKKHGHIICKEALEYKPMIFVSNGIGKSYIDSPYKVFDIERNMYVYQYQGYVYALPSYYRYKLYDEETRWHNNLIHKYELQDYLASCSNYRYSLNGQLYSLVQIEQLYQLSYRKFDIDDNKHINIKTLNYA